MAVGMKYDLKGQEAERELCNFDSVYRLAGGFNLDDDDVVNGSIIPSLAPLSINFKTRKAKISKSVKVIENISDTTLKIAKGSFTKVGMHLGTGSAGATINQINTSNELYDELTLSATISGVKKGDILFEATETDGQEVKNPANFLNYARVKKEAGATITAIGQAFEIQTEKLYAPISDKDKETLGARFMFV